MSCPNPRGNLAWGIRLKLQNHRKESIVKNLLLVTIVLLVAIVSGCSQKSEPSGKPSSEVEKAAVKIAESWLSLVDNGKYGESWDNAAEFFRNAIPKEGWEKTIESVRPAFGNVISREVKSATYTTSAPGAPDGEYVIIQFNTKFENKAEAIETVTPMKDKDGVWRVSGYFIK